MIDIALAVQVMIWLIVIGAFAASGQASIFHPLGVYLLFHGIVFVVRPLLIYYLHFDSIFIYMQIIPTAGDYLKTLAVSSVALVVFGAVGLLAGHSRRVGSMTPPPDFTRNEKRALLVTTLLLAPLIAYSITASVGGAVTGELTGGTYVLTGASGYTADAQMMAGPLICLWLAATRFNPMGLLPLILFVGYRVYCGWARWTIVLFFLGLALVYAWQKGRRSLPLWAVLLAIPLFMLFQTLGHNRDYLQMLLRGESVRRAVDPVTPEEQFKEKYDTQEFANFDYLCYVLKIVPERTGSFNYGCQYLQLFTEPIPRKLWPGKPVGAPVGFFSLNSFGNFIGLTVSLPGDGWMSGGWLGVIITMGLAGLMLGKAHQWFWNHAGNNVAALFYLVGLAMTPQWFRDGGISMAKFLMWNWLPLIFWLMINWLLGPKLVPGYSVVLPRGTQIRLMPPQ